MRDVTTTNADVTEEKSARFATIHTRQALPWESPHCVQLCGAFIQHPAVCRTPACYKQELS